MWVEFHIASVTIKCCNGFGNCLTRVFWPIVSGKVMTRRNPNIDRMVSMGELEKRTSCIPKKKHIKKNEKKKENAKSSRFLDT